MKNIKSFEKEGRLRPIKQTYHPPFILKWYYKAVYYIWIDASVNRGFVGRKCSFICLCAAEPLKRIIETVKSPVDADNYSNRVIYILIQDNAISICAEEIIWKLHKVKCGEILSITLAHKRYKNSWSHQNFSAKKVNTIPLLPSYEVNIESYQPLDGWQLGFHLIWR